MSVVVRSAAALLAALVVVGAIGGGILLEHAPSPSFAVTCPPAAVVHVGSIAVPAGPVAGYCQDRLVNAAHVIAAARALGIGQHTQAIGVMTALGESGLVDLDHGDAAGPDSRGIFQQRANGAWGSLGDRMTPYTAAYDFFAALVSIPSWKTLTPSQAAHRVQGNSDPNHYARYWDAAVTIVRTLNR